MDQPTFADLEYESKKRETRREIFLERMTSLIPWEQLEERIRPFYPKEGRGRRPYELSAMLRIHCVQFFYNLSDCQGRRQIRPCGCRCPAKMSPCDGSQQEPLVGVSAVGSRRQWDCLRYAGRWPACSA